MKPQSQSTGKGAFPKEQSLALKGIAILMMMWHHCFLEGRFEKHTINFWPLAQSQVINIANFCKICVSLFVFISGYGLYLTWQKAKKEHRKASQWCYEKLVRTLSGYWFVVILAWIVCTYLDNRIYRVYGFEKSVYSGMWNMIVDFLGLSNLVGGPQLNGTWWYMSAAVTFIVLLPILSEGFERIGCFCTLGIVLIFPRISMGFPGWVHFYSFLPIFCIGMIFARYDFFSVWNRTWKNQSQPTTALKFLLMTGGLLAVYKLFHHISVNTWWDMMWNFIPVLVIIFAHDYIFRFPLFNWPLLFIGKHATNIFLLHTFVRAYYCEAFIYGRGHFLLIMGTLLFISVGLSIIVEGLKHLINYERWIQKLLCLPYSFYKYQRDVEV